MSATRKAFCNNIWADDAADIPAAGQFIGQICFVMDSPVVIKRWDGASWVTVTPDFPGTGGGGGTDPLSLSPYLWIDAEMDSGTYVDNDPVSSATDQSGNGRDMTQATGGKQPTYKTGIVGGMAVYRFDGGDCLQRASVAVTSFTFVAVVRGINAVGIIYELGPDINTTDGAALYQDTPFIIVRNGGVYSTRTTGTNWGIQNEWLILCQHYNASGSHEGHSGWLHGFRPQYNTGTGNNPGTSTITNTLNLGARNNVAALPMTGDIAAFGLFTPALTTVQIEGVSQYLAARFDI